VAASLIKVHERHEALMPAEIHPSWANWRRSKAPITHTAQARLGVDVQRCGP
jgi:hypothetical protein